MAKIVSRNFGRLDQIPLSTPGLMREIGLLVQRLVVTRTRSGKDANGRAFQPLSPSYRAQKKKGVGSSRADLSVSGRMLNEFEIGRVTKNSVSVGYSAGGIGGGGRGGTFIQRSRAVSGAVKAFYHNESGAGKSKVKREFVGLTDADEVKIQNAVLAHLKTVL